MDSGLRHRKNIPAPTAGFCLKKNPDGLILTEETGDLSLRIDFTAPGFSRRGRKSWKQESLLRAVGRKPGKAPTVLDATGGTGRDAFVMASHGCRVFLYEKNPLLYHMLQDALDRALTFSGTRKAAARIIIRAGDSIEAMTAMDQKTRPEVVYLDPMYPERKKTALVKKEMRLLQKLCDHNDREEDLLAAAMACATARVVVKRPKSGPPLAGRAPDAVIKGAAHRFDIHILNPPQKRQTG